MNSLKNITLNTVLTLKLNIDDSIYIEKGTCLELLKKLSILAYFPDYNRIKHINLTYKKNKYIFSKEACLLLLSIVAGIEVYKVKSADNYKQLLTIANIPIEVLDNKISNNNYHTKFVGLSFLNKLTNKKITLFKELNIKFLTLEVLELYNINTSTNFENDEGFKVVDFRLLTLSCKEFDGSKIYLSYDDCQYEEYNTADILAFLYNINFPENSMYYNVKDEIVFNFSY